MFTPTHLPDQQKDEKTILFLRRHWITFFHQVIFYIILALFPFLFYYLLKNTSPEILEWLRGGELIYPVIILGISSFYLSIWLFFFHGFIDYYLDVWVVTNKRIVNIEQHGLFSRIISEQKLYRVQDVTSEVHGILPTLLHFGNVHVQTAGEVQRFYFKQVPYPYEVRKKIIELVERSKREHPEEILRTV